MTREEAKKCVKRIRSYMEGGECWTDAEFEAMDMAVAALGAIEQIQWERDTAIKQLNDLGYQFGRSDNYGMIDFDKLPEFEGFTVYDRETGEQVKPTDIKLSNGRTLYCFGDKFGFDEDGTFGVIPLDAEDWRTGMIDVKKEGKYIIQLGNGEYYKW